MQTCGTSGTYSYVATRSHPFSLVVHSLAFLFLHADLFRGAGLLLHLLHLDSLGEEVLRADVKLEILASIKEFFFE